MKKATKEEVNYREEQHTTRYTLGYCQLCEHWRENRCSEVKGKIDPTGWCILFSLLGADKAIHLKTFEGVGCA
jgi:hypothetical protein